MKKCLDFFGLFFCAIASIGGICYSLYWGEWVTALAVAVLTCYAYPAIKQSLKRLMD